MDTSIRYLIQILLKENTYVTSKQLAASVDFSEKTVRNRLQDVSLLIKDNGANLIAKPGLGYMIEIVDEVVFTRWKNEHVSNIGVLPSTSKERVQYLLSYLLDLSEYVKIEALSDMLFVSRNTISADLKQVDYILEMYDLSLLRRPNYGLIIKGSEVNRRLCIANSVYRNKFNLLDRDQTTEALISKIIQNLAKEKSLVMDESTYQSLVMHTFIANERITNNQYIVYSEALKSEIYKDVDAYFWNLAKALSDKIETTLQTKFNEDEIIYLALHLSGKIRAESKGKFGNTMVISSAIDELVIQMIERVFQALSIDFRNNLELRMSLNQHMVPLDIRLRYDLPLKNPIVNDIKREYALAYSAAVSACEILSEKYQKEIPEDEIGYIAIIFSLALQKREIRSRKYNIIIVCASGRGTSQLFMYRYKQAFGDYINNIHELTIFDLETFDYHAHEIDFIFTTIPINASLPVPIYEVSLFLDYKEIDSYQRIFEQGDTSFINHYFNENLFIGKMKGTDKEQVLEEMVHYLHSKLSLPDNFYDLVLKREFLGQTDFGNLVAIPHPYNIVKGQMFVMVAILDEPIWWGHNEVQVVFLISLDEQNNRDIQEFYRMITNYVSNYDMVINTIETPTFENLINQLEKAS